MRRREAFHGRARAAKRSPHPLLPHRRWPTLTDGTVTVRDRDSLKQWRVHENDLVAELRQRIG